MKLFPFLIIIVCSIGCASIRSSYQRPIVYWPESVATTCPYRTVPLECFRTSEIKEAMYSLNEGFRSCFDPKGASIMIRLRIETHGGTPSCVESHPQKNDSAYCVAGIVARHLKISNSTAEERCSFRYPVLFQSANND